MKNDLGELLKKMETVAIIGCSADKYRTSYHIAKYLQENGIKIIPVNPNYEEVLGEKCYANMTDLPTDVSVDIVDIFRDSQHTAEMVKDIINWSEETGQKPLIWTQLTVSSEEAKSLAKDGGFRYVENECLMVQHQRVIG